MSIETLKSGFDIATVVLLFLTFLAGAGVLITGNIINGRQASKLQQFDLDLAAATTEQDKQRERAATADARVAGLEKDAADAKAEMAKQQTRAALAEKNLLELQGQVEPRRLTESQKAELVRLLTGGGPNGVAIVTPLMDGEASDFADDFKSALEAANWQTVRIVNRISSRFGVAVVTCEGTGGPVLPLAKKLSDALTAAGIAHELTTFKAGDASTSPAFQAGYLYLVIEHKPLPTPNK